MSKQQEHIISQEYNAEVEANAKQAIAKPYQSNYEENLLQGRADCNYAEDDISDEAMIAEVRACSALIQKLIESAQLQRERNRKYQLQNTLKDEKKKKQPVKSASFFEKVTGYFATIFHHKPHNNSEETKLSQHFILGEQTMGQEKVEDTKQKVVGPHRTIQFFDKKSQ